jgi:hypothetical protein
VSVADFALEGAVWLEFGGAIAAYFGHLVAAIPGEVDIGHFNSARFPYVFGKATESEPASALMLEQEAGWLEHVGCRSGIQASRRHANCHRGSCEGEDRIDLGPCPTRTPLRCSSGNLG